VRPTELLLQYQRLGDRSRVLLDEKQRLEDRLNRHEKIEAAEAAVAAAETQLSELTRRFKAMDLEVEGHRGKMRTHERELMSGRIRSPTDLTKMSEEVSHMKARLLEEEEAELQLMTALEETEGELERARKALEAARAEAVAEAPALRERLAAVEKEIAELEAQREAVWAEIPPDLQSAYKRLNRIPNPVVEMVGGQCLGCRVQLTANELQQLRRGERFTCQNCSRILVLG